MTLHVFLKKITENAPISFAETIKVIEENYDYQPTPFTNGLADEILTNQAGTNEGSCKIFAFAKIHQLTTSQTLKLFGDYYTLDVLNDPNGTNHQNIRHFIKYGWEGIQFKGQALQPKILASF